MTYFGDATSSEADVQEADVVDLLDAQADVDASDDEYGVEVDGHSDFQSDIDSDLDAAIDEVNDGGASVRPVITAESLPLAMSTRDAFLHARDVPVTGDARVDAATARLSELVDLPTSDHAAVYDDVHRRLQDALADADQR